MSRQISNSKLAALLKASCMALHDLAAIVGVSRQELNAYFRGQSRPILERKLARVMRVAIPDLRDLLGIDQPAQASSARRFALGTTQGVFAKQKRRKRHAATAAEVAIFNQTVEVLSAYKNYKVILNRDYGRIRWVNGGAKFADNAEMQQRARDYANVPHLKIIRWRTGQFQTVRVLNAPRKRKQP